ncbi:MAG: tRNA (N(6)-L-threonylcarbamoyladenosine(37)-C(2))-methylthiotransferase MtaB [Candidatus Omnitrophica bacterium]|nr:tRNA (N(6)-L-threonylcarbamoyladenosine(37)-C(2))-methylthiotransferase MtaB [Candidatus Omnitrophota bacterium]
MEKIKFAVKALGCKVNQYEEQLIRENLSGLGFAESDPGQADIIILNSCTVTDTADAKTRKLIRKVKKDNPRAKVFVTGCYAVLQEDIKRLEAMPQVEGVIPGGDKQMIPLIMKKLFNVGAALQPRYGISVFSDHTRAFLKIQDGCDQNCSYCKVNVVRGPSRSRAEDHILEEAKRFISAGYREIVLTGICLGSWQGSRGQALPALIDEISRIKGDFRIRLSSLEPNHITDDLISSIAGSGKISRHLHIPLQSGSDRILRLMKRRYSAAQYRELIDKVRRKIPLVGLTMDVISGFPGETEEDFALSRELVEQLGPSRLHVFRYSDRNGTSASGFKDKVRGDLAKRRVGELINIGKLLQAEFGRKFIGREVQVLSEITKPGEYTEGYSGEYLRVRISGHNLPEGQILTALIEGYNSNSSCLVGKLAEI